VTVLLAVLVFALMILVHEGGHFLAAKACGVRVLEFALGLGPKLFGKKIGETEYALRVLPFGGMCAMEGEDEDSGDPRAFNNAKPWKRLIILLAGVAMNFLMGLLILMLVYAPAEQFVTATIDGFMDKYTGSRTEEGLLPGDTVLSIDGYRVILSSDISAGFSKGEDSYYDILVRRDGQKLQLHDVYVEPQEYEQEDGTVATYYGVLMGTETATFGATLDMSCRTAVSLVRMVFESLGMIFSGSVGLNDMSGPIGISATLSQAAKQDMSAFWYLTALIAINLAVMNLLPIPALDGARALVVLFEMVTRRKPNRRVEGWINGIGLVLLLALMAVIAFNDVWKLIFKS